MKTNRRGDGKSFLRKQRLQTERELDMYEFLLAARTFYHKLRGLKQHLPSSSPGGSEA